MEHWISEILLNQILLIRSSSKCFSCHLRCLFCFWYFSFAVTLFATSNCAAFFLSFILAVTNFHIHIVHKTYWLTSFDAVSIIHDAILFVFLCAFASIYLFCCSKHKCSTGSNKFILKVVKK